jgi:hypothetical protein
MNGSRDGLLGCLNCGTPNVTGVRSCVNCHAPYYYNCPYCNTWVDNSFSNCPGCGDKLNWPQEAYYEEHIDSPGRSATAAILLLMSIIVLSIVAIHLITNNTNPVNAVSHTNSVATINNLPANELKMTAQPEIQVYSPVTAVPTATQIDSSTSYADIETNSAEGSISYETLMINPVTPAATNTTDTYVPKSSSYLDNLYPNWGHCSGGSCSSYYQQ